MIKKNAYLSQSIFSKDIPKEAIRDGFGEAIVEIGRKDQRVVVLTADLRESTRCDAFFKEFPERSIEVGVAEQALVTIASGLANYGKIPFVCSFAIFSPGRNWEQIRTTIALNDVPVKIIGSHAGVSVGEDGATHQALEDMALMRVMPNMAVLVPVDKIEAKKAVYEAVRIEKPVYIRLSRPKTPVFTTEKTPFAVGKAQIFWESKNPVVTIVGCGYLVYEALKAARKLEKYGIGSIVLNASSIKPFDNETLLRCAKITNAVVTVEEHQIKGGLGGEVSETLAANFPVPVEFVGMPDAFGESGKDSKLLEKWGMTCPYIIEAVKRVLKRRNL